MTIEFAKLILEGITALVAFIALLIARNEYQSHKRTEYHKLFSQLNKRYEGNKDIQDVIKYLREKESYDQEPSMYQLEVFLRFFEELGLYLITNSIKAEDVNCFFGYYLQRLYTSPQGKSLLKQLGEEEKDLELLQHVKTKLKIEI